MRQDNRQQNIAMNEFANQYPDIDAVEWTPEMIVEFAHHWKYNVAEYDKGYVRQGMASWLAKNPPKAASIDGGRYADWEVLQYRLSKSGEVVPAQVQPKKLGVPESFEIFSVLRQKDKNVFTVDEITPDGQIERFELYNEQTIKVHLRGDKYLWFHTLEKKITDVGRDAEGWLVQSYKTDYRGNKDVIFNRGDGDRFSALVNDQTEIVSRKERDLINSPATIHSVLRLSDKKELSIGDKDIDGDTIESFKIFEDSMRVYFNKGKSLWIEQVKLPHERIAPKTGSVSQQLIWIEERLAYIEKKLNIEG